MVNGHVKTLVPGRWEICLFIFRKLAGICRYMVKVHVSQIEQLIYAQHGRCAKRYTAAKPD